MKRRQKEIKAPVDCQKDGKELNDGSKDLDGALLPIAISIWISGWTAPQRKMAYRPSQKCNRRANTC
ncbi:hypothetical protein L596_001783 [Steinernema carpocapsae]|uniref:Uncharacterized protein n=1 Tax=Steinernema carpocapsae TaxID=34508 RepID=A0A4V6I787_STECR|nr:hypothetical protein L596_001783 [Steinernema carpocapsae]